MGINFFELGLIWYEPTKASHAFARNALITAYRKHKPNFAKHLVLRPKCERRV